MSPAVLRANPFMLPQNLADRAVLIASGADKTPVLSLQEAEQQLLSTSLLPAVRAQALRSSGMSASANSLAGA